MSAARGTGFGHVETWVFDLDNTLYPADCDLFSQIDQRMGAFIADQLDVSLDDAHAVRRCSTICRTIWRPRTRSA